MVVPFLCNAWPNKVAQASSLACGRVLQARRGTSLSDWQARGMRYLRRLVASSVAIALAASAFGQQKPEAVPRDTGSDLLWKKLETRVEEIAARLDGVMGVAILDLTDGRILLRNADRFFPTASSIKIAILLELYRQDQEVRAGVKGKAKLDDIYIFDPKDLFEDSQIMAGLTPGVTRVTNRDLAQFMVAVSDNAATNVLIDRVGMQNVNATMRSLGLTKTMLRRKMIDVAAARRGDENVSTPQEMVRLFEMIYKGKALNKELTDELIKQLKTLKKDSYLSYELPADVELADKPGSLDGVRNDTGIVFAHNRPFAISVMTAYDRDEKAAERAISGVALEAYHYFEMRGKTSEYGRILPQAENR
ncbi:MAG: serine hydrolase [Verrucomicrobia bacterium]|nr:MAG: serine hydrolase [Verrucomicrobiota bacterium]